MKFFKFKKFSKNSSGLTLIELIVATAVLSVLIGGALMYTKPVSENYKETGDFTNINSITSNISDYVTDRLRYATDVLILDNYNGHPVTSADKINGVKYSRYFIFDETTVYGSEGQSSFNKNCTGRVLVSPMGLSGVDVANANIIMGNAAFGDYYFDFNINKLTSSAIGIDILAKPAVKDSTGTYVSDYKNRIPSSIAIECLNIKNNDGKEIKYVDFASGAAYSSYPQVTGSEGKTYTYVFFNEP